MVNIIGCKVVHAKWGIGVIESIAENIMCVHFPESPDGDLTKNFIFPNAIKDKHIVGYDSHVNLLINELIRERKCSICGRQALGLVNVDGRFYCSTCKKTFTGTCCSCGIPHYRLDMESVYDSVDTIRTELICQECIPQKSFKCQKCDSRYLNKNHARGKWASSDMCIVCAEEIEKRCHYCDTIFEGDLGESFFLDDEIVYVCPRCLGSKTFECSRCGTRELLENCVDTKYVPSSKLICDTCVTNCSLCNEAIVNETERSAFGKYFCPECWETKVQHCSICSCAYYPETPEIKLCPDCVEMEAYKSRLKNVNYLSNEYQKIWYYQLADLDRCKLFTDLYINCKYKMGSIFSFEPDNPYYFIVLDFAWYKVAVTYLSNEVIGKNRDSANVTMTQFLRKNGARKARLAIERWKEHSFSYMDTTAGKMRILNHPVRLRVQTGFDKNYGKRWNGPDDYIEIGNYGDTTDFYIVGVIEK